MREYIYMTKEHLMRTLETVYEAGKLGRDLDKIKEFYSDLFEET